MSGPTPIFTFDIDKLLSPIAPDNPSGNSLRYDPLYDRIQDLRREDDSSLPQGVWKRDLKHADWTAVEALCVEVLETRSKDLQIAAWLLEAWVHLHGFAGATEGLHVVHTLADVFWNDIHPRIQDSDTEFRIAPFSWLNDKLPPLLKLQSLTEPETDDVAVCTLAAWERATQKAHPRSGPEGKNKEQGASIAQLEQGALLTPTARLVAKLNEVRAMLKACAETDQLLDEKLGREAPGLIPIRSTGEQAAALLQSLLRDRGVPSPQAVPEDEEDEDLEYTGDPGDPGLQYYESGVISSRAEAYRMLADAAEYLARTEPHSPTPYLVRRAITWGTMSLDQLLPELVRNPAELSDIFRLLDVLPPSAGKR